MIAVFKKFFHDVCNAALLFFYLVLFSSIENSDECNRGYLLSLFFVVISPSPARKITSALFLLELVLVYFKMHHLSYICFFIIISRYFYGITIHASEQSDSSDDTVEFQPYESEIRKFLMKKDPSKLHLVDAMLKKYDYNGKELLAVLHEEYGERDKEEKVAFIRKLLAK